MAAVIGPDDFSGGLPQRQARSGDESDQVVASSHSTGRIVVSELRRACSRADRSRDASGRTCRTARSSAEPLATKAIASAAKANTAPVTSPPR
jgi:hypothetical protein